MKRHAQRPNCLTIALLLSAAASAAAGLTIGVAEAADSDATRWTCSMHPQIILPDNSQQCPLCFMDLIPLEEEAGTGLNPGELSLTESAAALAEIETARVERRAAAREIRLVGRVEADPGRVRTITARFGGRLDRLHVAATGLPVQRAAKLAEIYSPELYSAQAELQAAAAAVADARAAGRQDAGAQAVLESVRARLRLWSLEPAEIKRLQDSIGPSDRWPVHAPADGIVLSLAVAEGDYVQTGSELYRLADLSTVWAVLEAWESDVAWLRPGQDVEFTARAYPGRRFAGSILFVEPVLDARSRTVAVRVEVPNPGGLLKPGMLLSASAHATIDAHGSPVAGGAEPLLIPVTAPLLTGERAVVYVRRPGSEPVFAGREIVLGPRAGDSYVVVEGLAAGEEVVTSGAFKIDSALQIQARPSMMNPEGEVMQAGHDHGGHGAPPTAAPIAVPGTLRAQESADWGDRAALKEYFALQAALAADDDAAATAAAAKLATALKALPDAEGEKWPAALADLRSAAVAVAASSDLAARRLAFQPLSDRLWLAFESFGAPAGGTVRRFHCPMAMDGAGAAWIQEGKTTANPYYGAMMLRCGSEVAALGADGHGAEGH